MLKHRLRRVLAMLALWAILACGLTQPAAAAGFRDVPAGHWAAAEIARCVEKGFFQGQTADHFGLGQAMTRSAFTVVLCRFFGWGQTVTGAAPYTDIPAGAWYAGAIDAAYAHGALTRQDTQFRPAEPITREELTVMLLRALGYTTLSGLAEELGHPFTDVSANAGYVTLAHDMGLMNGTTTTTFAPDRYATREQVAVILMRLYDKLHSGTSLRLAVLTDAENLPSLEGLDAAAIPAFRLIGAGGAKLTPDVLDETAAAAARSAVKSAGAKALLYVTGGPSALSADPDETVRLLASAVAEGSYDGLLLDIPGRKTDGGLTALTKKLDAALGDRLLYLAAEAPVWHGTGYGGYLYTELAKYADRIFLRLASHEERSAPVAPAAPPEDVYFALQKLRASVPADKLGLLLESRANLWQNGTITGSLTAGEVSALLAEKGAEAYYSDHYASAYLTKGTSQSVWYLTGESIAARVQLLRLFASDALCLTDLNAASADVLAALGQ